MVVDVNRARPALAGVLPPEQLITDPVALLTYNRDAGLDPGMPDAVALPTSTTDVARLMQWAAQHGVPLIARGAGTGLSGGAVAEHGGIILTFSRMEQILDFDELGGSITVQPGITSQDLDLYVKTSDWYYPPDPSSGRAATIGGNIGENSGGPHCFKYGVTTNYVIGLEVVLADGTVVQLGGQAFDYPEYDLVAVLTGSEGTLGVITQASLRLIRTPPAVQTLLASFDSVEQAGEAVSAMIARGLVPATMEMMDRRFMRVIEDFAHAGLPVEAGAALIVEVDGYPDSIAPQMEEVMATLNERGAYDLRVAQTADERSRIWYGRKSAAGAIARLAPAFYLVDGTVPRSKLAPVLADVNQICEEQELRVVYVFHAGDGNLHPLILIEDTKDQAHVQRVIEAGRQIVARCVEEDGSITGEHGVGIEKREFMPLMYNPDELHAMQDVKEVFDPRYLLNPHKILPSTMPPLEPLPTAGTPPSTPFSPATAAEAAEAIRAWTAAGQTIRVRGAGTKSRHLPPANATLCTDQLGSITTLALDDQYVTVGAGMPLAQLQHELAQHGMWVPLASPWQQSTVGGIVATGYNAPLRLRYGGIRDNVLSTVVALPNGRVIRAGRPVVKNVAGYDLPRLFAGSFGTLGLLTDITLKLAPLPRARVSLVAGIADGADGTALHRALHIGSELLRLRLVCAGLLLCAGQTVGLETPLALVYTGEGLPDDVATELGDVEQLLRQRGVGQISHRDDVDATALWATLLNQPDASTTLVRLGVPPGAMPQLAATLAPVLAAAPFALDLSSGLAFVHLPDTALLAELRRAAMAQGGYAVAPLHAGSTAFDAWGYTPQGLPLMRAIKARWDASGLFNPGAFIV